jgi:hypothetical protein
VRWFSSLIGRATFGFSETDYLLPTTVKNTPTDRIEHLYQIGATLLRRFSDNIRIDSGVTYYRRLSTIPLNSYER